MILHAIKKRLQQQTQKGFVKTNQYFGCLLNLLHRIPLHMIIPSRLSDTGLV